MKKNTNLNNTNSNNTIHSGFGDKNKSDTPVNITNKSKPKQNKINNKWIDTYITILLILIILDIWNPNFALTSYNYIATYVSENVSVLLYAYLCTDMSLIESVYLIFGDHIVDKLNLTNLQNLSDSDPSTPELTDDSGSEDNSFDTDEAREHLNNLLEEIRARTNGSNAGLAGEALNLGEEIRGDLDQVEETESYDESEDTSDQSEDTSAPSEDTLDQSENTSDDANQQTDSSNETKQNADISNGTDKNPNSSDETNQNAGSSNHANQNTDTSDNSGINLYSKNNKKYIKLNNCSPFIHNTLTASYYSTLTSESFHKISKSTSLKILGRKIKHILLPINAPEHDKEDNSNTLHNMYINLVNKIRHSPPANKEWVNSTYLYNKLHKNFPILDKILSRSIKSHFNLYSNKLRNKIRKHGSKRFEIRKSRRLMNKVFIGKPELKHSNDNINVTVYVYNAEKKYLINKVKKIPAIYKINTVNKLSEPSYRKDETKIPFLNRTSRTSLNIKSRINSYKSKFFLLKDIRTKKHVSANKHQRSFFKTYVRKFLRKEVVSNHYRQILIFNRQKFEKRYIKHLADNIAKMYKKKIEFNFINLKHIYLDSQIFSISLVTKLKRLAKKKKSFLIGLKRFFNMFKIPRISSLDVYNQMFNIQMVNQSISNNNILAIPSETHTKDDDYVNTDIIDNTLKYQNYITTNINNFKDSTITRFMSIFTEAYNSFKYKIVNGVRLEVSGRFTKRSSAARSVFKIRNKGSIKNKDSSYKGLPAILLMGYAKSNLQFNKIFSKVRGGSFGIKSSLSGA